MDLIHIPPVLRVLMCVCVSGRGVFLCNFIHVLIRVTTVKRQNYSITMKISLYGPLIITRALLHPISHPGHHWSFPHLYNLVFSRMLFKWNHAGSDLLKWASLTLHNAFEVYPSRGLHTRMACALLPLDRVPRGGGTELCFTHRRTSEWFSSSATTDKATVIIHIWVLEYTQVFICLE